MREKARTPGWSFGCGRAGRVFAREIERSFAWYWVDDFGAGKS